MFHLPRQILRRSVPVVRRRLSQRVNQPQGALCLRSPRLEAALRSLCTRPAIFLPKCEGATPAETSAARRRSLAECSTSMRIFVFMAMTLSVFNLPCIATLFVHVGCLNHARIARLFHASAYVELRSSRNRLKPPL